MGAAIPAPRPAAGTGGPADCGRGDRDAAAGGRPKTAIRARCPVYRWPMSPRREVRPSSGLVAMVLRRLGRAAALALAGLLALAGPASAHAIGGAGPTNFQTRILAVKPAVPGIDVRVVEAGSRLELTNTSGREVIVLGYASEPYLRIGPDGVFENERSPATFLNKDSLGQVQVPSTADAKAAPEWKKVSGANHAAWHDHRVHWMGQQPPPEVQDAPGQVHVVNPTWTVPLRLGEQQIAVTGDLRWVPGPSPLPSIVVAVGLCLLALVAGRLRSWPRLLAVLLGLLIVIDVVYTGGTWTALRSTVAVKAYGSLIAAAGWAVGVVAIVQLLRNKLESGLFYLIFAAGLMTVIGGLGDLPALTSSQLVSDLPDWATRAAVASKVGLGLGIALAGLLRLRQTGRPPAEPAPTSEPQVPQGP